MNADEMFKKLGYFSEDEGHICYRKHNSKHTSSYIFNVIDKSINVSRYDNFNHMSKNITMEQLKAINKKCEELGWYD